jgi:hypothetical protein
MSTKKENTSTDIEAKIAQWKKEYGEVHKLKVTDPEDENKVYVCYVKKPSKNHLAVAFPHIQNNPVKAGDILRENCYIEGDPEILAKDECILAVNIQMFELFKIAKVEVEKL